MEIIQPDLTLEFPTINPDFKGKKTKYAYLGSYIEHPPRTQEEKDNANFGSFVKMDLERG
jgi:carotenoid cleavage dioxygenase-like enzyme